MPAGPQGWLLRSMTMITNLEDLMYQVSDLFMAPVLILLVLLFFYSLFALGSFAMMALQRRKNKQVREYMRDGRLADLKPSQLAGYPIASHASSKSNVTSDELDVAALEEMEGVRMVSRLAPMLGLIATMVPMGPALKSLADGDVQGISDNLIVAFSAVIFGLVIASITFWIASVKKRWLAAELVGVAPYIEQKKSISEEKAEAPRAAA